MTDPFLTASKLKLRFSGGRQGRYTVEDLWDLKLEDLDTLAVDADKRATTGTTKSFIKSTANRDTEAELQLEILKSIIGVKIKAKEDAAARAQKAQQRAVLLELKGRKANDALAQLTPEQIDAQLIALGDD